MDGQDAERNSRVPEMEGIVLLLVSTALVDDFIRLSVDSGLLSIEIVSEGWRLLL